MKEALSFIEQNYQNDISIEDIAVFCGLNRNYFGKIFRSTMGKTPQEFLLSYRMAKAAQLLKETTLSVAAISVMVSYQNPLHFSRAFKNIYGCSPRQYRQSWGWAAFCEMTSQMIIQSQKKTAALSGCFSYQWNCHISMSLRRAQM